MHKEVFIKHPYYELDQKRFWLKKYHPYRNNSNPNFDNFSRKILDLKKTREAAINYFYQKIEPVIYKNVLIVTVPSSDPRNIDTGINEVARRLAEKGCRNATSCLKRYKQVEKKSNGGKRDIIVDLNSIKVMYSCLIKGKTVLLLDDITTTGNSFRACEKLLLDAGAYKVVKLALGKTAIY